MNRESVELGSKNAKIDGDHANTKIRWNSGIKKRHRCNLNSVKNKNNMTQIQLTDETNL